MVMRSSTQRGRVFKFHSHALVRNTLLVGSFQGREAISQPFRFEVDLVSQKADLDATAILQVPADLVIKQGVPLSGGGGKRGVQELKIHGVVASFEQFGRLMGGWVSYRAVLVPSLWKLSLGKHTRIFQEKKVPEIVEEVLKGAGLGADEYEFRTSAREYPKSEYIVQYQESDLNFISRLLEHEGIFYYFEHADEATKVVFGDSPSASVPILGDMALPYRPHQAGSPVPAGDWFDQEKVVALGSRENRIPAEVVLRDYNYRTPSVDLKVSAPVVAEGFGQYYEYGDHYKDQGEGKAYAQVRAEEIKCRQKLFRGEGDSRSFRTGHTYTLADHYRPGFNATYLLTEVRHTASQTIELAGVASRVSATYSNEFDSIPADVVFRPARVTPKPRIHGTMHARVDAAGEGKYAEIDDQGRYKVQIPFDLSGKDKATATRWIRKAEPYTGPDYGIHFPLHKGAEVILTHIDGDPDRPIIVNAVPNPEMGSPVKGANQSQCIIRTGGGNQMVIEDSEGGEQIKLSSPHGGTKLWLGAPNGPAGGGIESGNNWSVKVGVDEIKDIGANASQKVGANQCTEVGGNSFWDVKGSKTKTVLGHDGSFVLGGKSETIIGGKASVILGGKTEAVAPLIMSASAGLRVTCEAGFKLTYGPGHKESRSVKMIQSACEEHDAGVLKENVATLLKDVGSMNEKIGSLTESVGSLTANVGKWNLTGGNVEWTVGAIVLKGGGSVTVEAGGAATIKGATIGLNSSSIELMGHTSCSKDFDIDGALAVQKSVDIRGKLVANGVVDLG